MEKLKTQYKQISLLVLPFVMLAALSLISCSHPQPIPSTTGEEEPQASASTEEEKKTEEEKTDESPLVGNYKLWEKSRKELLLENRSSSKANEDLLFLTINPKSCVNLANGKLLLKKECNSLKNQCSRHSYGSEDGHLFVELIEDNFTVNRVQLETFDEAAQFNESTINAGDFDKILYKVRYYACATVSAAGERFLPRDFSNHLPEPSWTTEISGSTMEAWEKRCFVKMPDLDEIQSLEKLSHHYLIKKSESYVIAKWLSTWRNMRDQCSHAISSICKNTYPMNNLVVATYATRGYGLREVTRNDVEKDLNGFRDNEFITEAGILNHERLRDRIDFCQRAHDKDWRWAYQAPSR